jgi:hypothetical protein
MFFTSVSLTWQYYNELSVRTLILKNSKSKQNYEKLELYLTRNLVMKESEKHLHRACNADPVVERLFYVTTTTEQTNINRLFRYHLKYYLQSCYL